MKDTNIKTNLTESRSQWMANALYFPTVEVCLHKAWHQGMCFIVFMFKLFMISEKKKNNNNNYTHKPTELMMFEEVTQTFHQRCA